MKNIDPSQTLIWHKLKEHYQIIKDIHLRELFMVDKNRFKKYSLSFHDQILVDFSKNRITDETVSNLLELAKKTNLSSAINSMYSGKKINKTENRAVLHVALRNRSNASIIIDGIDIMLQVNNVLEKMRFFSESVINGIWRGYTGLAITDIVNIGIGGSYLGSYMVIEALSPYKNHLNMHFVSNVDGNNIIEIFKKIKPETTIFLIASKSFTTQDTITNAYTAKTWFLATAKNLIHISKHFIALSANKRAVIKFGIDIRNLFELWDWVGGRYSLWSSIGLPIALSVGFDNFLQLLNGAHEMDKHFYHTSFQHNIPVILALISLWYNNFFYSETEAILTYDQYLRRFVTYFQHVNMESNGKYIDRNGKMVCYQTGPIIWGGLGTNAQHAFCQLMHQGTKLIPCDFIASVVSHNSLIDHHRQLMANFFAQSEALAFGVRSIKHVNKFKYFDDYCKDSNSLLSHHYLVGNHPSNSILINKITPFNLGALIAMYEHKIFTQGVILNIFSFDQWGVEISKDLANNIVEELTTMGEINSHDSSTNGLINYYKYHQKY
uniref:Glucose-6-phosphate isomerase n=1 Tax=Candidatus Aschnera chinzeii TaxID=1485666 RepID=A0AAT9G574_9ENTR|nr:MAG: glucose-6-phosphate isomerase [Candidatus Aschnera chinzeii]